MQTVKGAGIAFSSIEDKDVALCDHLSDLCYMHKRGYSEALRLYSGFMHCFPEYKDRMLGAPPPPAPVGPQHLRRCNGCCKAGCGLKCCSEPTAPQKCCCLARVKTPDKCPLRQGEEASGVHQSGA